MGIIFSTDLFRRLRWKHLLESRPNWLDIPLVPYFDWLVELNRAGTAVPPPSESPDVLEKLRNWKLITRIGPTDPSHKRLPLPFVTAINYELTYDCTLSRSHCLQRNIRRRLAGTWLDTETAKRSITEAWFAGLLTTGINFTGGEIVDSRSNLPELLETTKMLKLPFRLDTNGTWGEKKSIVLGSNRFTNARHVIAWLRKTTMEVWTMSGSGSSAK